MRLILFLFISFTPFLSFSQVKEIGIQGGGMYYIGDLNPNEHFKNVNPSFGVLYRQSPNDRISYRLNFLYGSVEGYDSQADSEILVNRNLHFQSDIYELGGKIEISFFPYIIGDYKKPFTPYLFAGISYFRMNPKAEINGNWIELQPLSTEGQGTSARPGTSQYSLNQIAIPFGIGFKFNLSDTWAMGIEWGMRKTFTDYLDDVSTTYADRTILAEEVGPLSAELSDRSTERINQPNSQRGTHTPNDWYIFTGVSLVYRIGGAADTCPNW